MSKVSLIVIAGTTIEEILGLEKGILVVEGIECSFEAREVNNALVWYKEKVTNATLVFSQADFITAYTNLGR